MLDVQSILLLFTVGLAAGFVAGLIGIGGGLFYVIVYSFFLSKFNFESEQEFVRMVISNSILSTFFAALAASIKQYKTNFFFPKPVIAIGFAGLTTSILLTFIISKTSFYNKDVFAIVFTIAILPLIWKMMTKPVESNVDETSIPIWKYIAVGLVSGAGTALSGLGGSFVTTPFLNGLYKIDIRKVVSISIGVIVIVAGGTTIYSLLFQHYSTQIPYTFNGINFFMVMPVVIAVMIAAPFGVKVSRKTDPKSTRILFLVFCLSVIVRNVIELLQ